jgi:hypothetical protein
MPVDGILLLAHPVVLLHMLPVTSTRASVPDIVSPATVAFPVKTGNWFADWSQVGCVLGTTWEQASVQLSASSPLMSPFTASSGVFFPGVALSAGSAAADELGGADAEAGLELGGTLLVTVDAEVPEDPALQAATAKDMVQATATARTTA